MGRWRISGTPGKTHKPEEIVAQAGRHAVVAGSTDWGSDLRQRYGAARILAAGKEFGGLKSDPVKRLKDLGQENERIGKAVSDLTLEKLILAEAVPRKRLSPARHCHCVEPVIGAAEWRFARVGEGDSPGSSQRQKCAFGWSFSVVRVESAIFDSNQPGLPRLK